MITGSAGHLMTVAQVLIEIPWHLIARVIPGLTEIAQRHYIGIFLILHFWGH